MSRPSLSIRKHFAKLKDPRVPGRTEHRLIDLIAIAVCAVVCGCDDWAEVETFARRRSDWLKRALGLRGGVPSHDTFERVFDRLDPQAFQGCLLGWLRAVSGPLNLRHVAIDGKALRGSAGGAAALGPLHLVSAWATASHLTLGQVAVGGKSNEIEAIPRLLELLDLSGALVTIDAMGCQKEVARQITEAGGDYVLTVKDNQPRLLEDIRAAFERALDADFAGWDHDCYRTEGRGHGRHERRCYAILRDLGGIRDRDAWAGLRVIGMCYSERTAGGETGTEVRYFIGSLRASARRYGAALRGHWRIENCCHWHLDVTFGEDASRVRGRRGAENLAVVRRAALSLLKRHPARQSIKCKRLAAALDTDFLEETLRGAESLENL